MANSPLPCIPCTFEDARHSLELAKSILDRAHALWENASKTLEETQAMHKGLHSQIEELATRGAFRREFTATLLTGILDAAVEGTGADMGNIQLLDPQTGRLQIRVHRGFHDPFLQFFNSVHSGKAACGTALKTGRRIVVPDVADSPVFPESDCLEALLDAGVRAVQSTPIIGKSGRFRGMLSTHCRNVRQPSPKDLQLIDYYVNWAAALLDADDRAIHINDRSSAHNGDRTPFAPEMLSTRD